ncbi:T9SS type A sorting domain-containing protein [Fluviicola sp.]|uniref:T9SS type A sorting domain-containing protein n=1 Tax=Fluviicola sp. TaxID=1917219 RepID=UPI003D298262
MKKSLLFIFALISLSSLAQSIWTKGNAVWHYRFFNVGETGYIKVWENGDTTLLGKQCTKLKAERHSFMMTGPNGNYFESVSGYISGIVYTSNDTVFHWDVDHFSVLYDFSATMNDTWYLQTGGSAFGCNDTSICVVQSAATVTIDGENYPELTLSHAPGSNVYLSGKANSRFGSSQGYLLPFPTNCDSSIVEYDQVSFICFEDDSLYYNPNSQSCEMHLGVNEAELNHVSVFPNPSSGKIELLSDIPLRNIQVVNVIGTLLKEFDANLTLTEIDLTELPQGTYYLKIENSNGEHSIKPIQISGR